MRILILFFLWAISINIGSSQTRVKRMEQDRKFNNRTNVVKEEGVDDYMILDEQFADAKPGQVVRINIEKVREKKEKPVKEKVEREPVEKEKVKPEAVERPGCKTGKKEKFD